jgi:hypothetical protein
LNSRPRDPHMFIIDEGEFYDELAFVCSGCEVVFACPERSPAALFLQMFWGGSQ